MNEALKLLRWVLTDMVYSAPELAAEKKQVWMDKLQRAQDILDNLNGRKPV